MAEVVDKRAWQRLLIFPLTRAIDAAGGIRPVRHLCLDALDSGDQTMMTQAVEKLGQMAQSIPTFATELLNERNQAERFKQGIASLMRAADRNSKRYAAKTIVIFCSKSPQFGADMTTAFGRQLQDDLVWLLEDDDAGSNFISCLCIAAIVSCDGSFARRICGRAGVCRRIVALLCTDPRREGAQMIRDSAARAIGYLASNDDQFATALMDNHRDEVLRGLVGCLATSDARKKIAEVVAMFAHNFPAFAPGINADYGTDLRDAMMLLLASMDDEENHQGLNLLGRMTESEPLFSETLFAERDADLCDRLTDLLARGGADTKSHAALVIALLAFRLPTFPLLIHTRGGVKLNAGLASLLLIGSDDGKANSFGAISNLAKCAEFITAFYNTHGAVLRQHLMTGLRGGAGRDRAPNFVARLAQSLATFAQDLYRENLDLGTVLCDLLQDVNVPQNTKGAVAKVISDFAQQIPEFFDAIIREQCDALRENLLPLLQANEDGVESNASCAVGTLSTNVDFARIIADGVTAQEWRRSLVALLEIEDDGDTAGNAARAICFLALQDGPFAAAMVEEYGEESLHYSTIVMRAVETTQSHA